MQKEEIAQRNLVSTIHACLAEHEVQVLGEGGVPEAKFLIEVHNEGSMLRDFLDTYGPVSDQQRKFASALMKEKSGAQVYGVFVDPNLRLSFAFNRRLGHYDRDQQRVVYFSPEEILLALAGDSNIDLQDHLANFFAKDPDFSDKSGKPEPEPPEPNPMLEALDKFEESSSDPGDMMIRYAAAGKKKTGKKTGKKKAKKNKPATPDFETNNLIQRVREAYSDKEVPLNVGGKTRMFYMIEIDYSTDAFEDFTKVYGGEADEFKTKIAKETFGGKRTNRYVLFVNKNLRIEFAYLKKFGEYDPKASRVFFKPLAELLLEELKQEDLAKKPPKPKPPVTPPSHSSGRGRSMVFRYALTGPKQAENQD